MVYRRRYLAGQEATTVVIAEGAITSDKIVDKAVTQPKIDDNAITTEKISPGGVESSDIKNATIQTEDLKNGSVTGEKIAESTIPESKLSFSPSTRPLSPGVDTGEIQDAKVTLAKLAPNSVNASKIVAGGVGELELAGDAVTENKIKDGEISVNKYRPSSVNDVALAANSVGGTEIKAGAVGVTELGTNAVETIKIKDGNVTEPKLDVNILTQRLIEASYVDKSFFFDDFLGTVLDDAWTAAGTAGGSVVLVGSDVKIKTGPVDTNTYKIDWNGIRSLTFPNALPHLLVKTTRDSLTYFFNSIGLWYDADNHIILTADEGVGGAPPNWYLNCKKGGVLVVIDTGIAVKTTEQELKIEYLATNSVKAYIDGVAVAHQEAAAGIPITTFEVLLQVLTHDNVTRDLLADYVILTQDRVSP